MLCHSIDKLRIHIWGNFELDNQQSLNVTQEVLSDLRKSRLLEEKNATAHGRNGPPAAPERTMRFSG